MYPEFAYSSQMQVLLAVISFFTTFFSMYLIANIILTIYRIPADRKQKSMFALITGFFLQSVWVYGIFLLGGQISFSPLEYYLVVSPNPFFALLYYYVAIKLFQLSPIRSIRMMSYVYLYWIMNKNMNRLLGSIFFVQTESRYNYLLDALQQICMFVLFLLICTGVQALLKRHHTTMKIVDNMFFNNRAELLLYFAKASFLYAVTVVLPLIISDRITVNLIINLIMLLFFVINICVDTIINTKYVIGSRDMHISVLFKGMEEYIGVKQNIYQILHTYSDYLEYGEYERLKEYHATLVKATSQSGNSMELARKMNENPSLISLLISKLEYAEKMKVKLIYSLQCDLSTFYIDPMELIRILSCLLDNAIEAAAESNERKVHLSVEARENGSKFLIISNSTVGPVDVDLITTRGVSSKPGHSGIGLTSVRDILEKYGNCSMQIKYLDEEFSAYLEIRENPHSRKES